MKTLVTGATGYIGHSLALALANKGKQVNILVRNPSSVNIPVHQNIHVFKGDIQNRDEIKKAMLGCDQVYHIAALVKFFSKDPGEFFRINVDGTQNILAVAYELKINKLVYTSTCGVLGASLSEPLTENDPRITGFDNDYEITKFMAENLVKQFAQKGLGALIVSISKVFGPGIETHPLSVNLMIKNFISGKPGFIPNPGSYSSNFCFINDIIEGHMLAMEKGRPGEKYIIGGENISYDNFFDNLRTISASKARLFKIPKWIAVSIARVLWLKYKLFGGDLKVTAKGLNQLYCNKEYSNLKAVQQLGYEPTPIISALQATIHFLNQKK